MLPTMMRRTTRPTFWDTFGDFDRALSQWWGNGGEEYGDLGRYPVDIREDDEHFYVEAEMPGFKKDEVDITLEKGVLHISAERKTDEKTDQGQKHLHERRFTRLARSFTLPTAVDDNKVDASLDGGVLYLTLHKREEVKPRKISVK